ncbi:MAG: hypothetical protein QOI58_1856 [Thermoanaerobaculia bacterium]|jgi:hypothetical protein|nr:hypothetical protein [Thermoanaerobaculia bacterium]
MGNGQTSIDLVIEKRGNPIVAVETRNVESPSAEWAAEFLTNILEYGEVPRCTYFLFALRNRMYLWRDPKLPVSLPDFEGDTADALQPHLIRLRRSVAELSLTSFQMLVEGFLFEIVMGVLPDYGDRTWLVDSGFADAIRNAYIRQKIAA